jgi:rubrerythrin
MGITRDEVVAQALQLERDGRKFYLEAAAKSGSEIVKQVLTGLADDESLHIQWIESELGVNDPDIPNRELYGKLRAVFADEPDRAAATKDDLDALNYALAIEKKASTTYAQWSEEADCDAAKELCRVLAGVEKFHAQLIENTLEYLAKPGDWFQQQERWFFEG